MRIAAIKSWLLAALSLASPAAADSGDAAAHVGFDSDQGFAEYSGGPAIIVVNTAGDQRKSFKWTINEEKKVKVNRVDLYVNTAEGKGGDLKPTSQLIGGAEVPLNDPSSDRGWDGVGLSIRKDVIISGKLVSPSSFPILSPDMHSRCR